MTLLEVAAYDRDAAPGFLSFQRLREVSPHLRFLARILLKDMGVPQLYVKKKVEKVLKMLPNSAYKILMVDDDPKCLDALDQILQREDYETFPVCDGRAAIETMAETRIDLAIVDFDLPDMDGLHVLYELKRIRRGLPVIIMTARSPKEMRLAALEAGAHSFIPKPINIPSFRQIVARALSAPVTRTVTIRRTRWIRWIIHR